MEKSLRRDFERDQRLHNQICVAAAERRCNTCAFYVRERQGEVAVAICTREQSAKACADIRAIPGRPGCGSDGFFWAWGGPIFVPPLRDPTPTEAIDRPPIEEPRFAAAKQSDPTRRNEYEWSTLLRLVNFNARDTAALASLMWQAAANWDGGKVANQLVFHPVIGIAGIADTLDHYQVPVLPAAIALARGSIQESVGFAVIGLG